MRNRFLTLLASSFAALGGNESSDTILWTDIFHSLFLFPLTSPTADFLRNLYRWPLLTPPSTSFYCWIICYWNKRSLIQNEPRNGWSWYETWAQERKLNAVYVMIVHLWQVAELILLTYLVTETDKNPPAFAFLFALHTWHVCLFSVCFALGLNLSKVWSVMRLRIFFNISNQIQ